MPTIVPKAATSGRIENFKKWRRRTLASLRSAVGSPRPDLPIFALAVVAGDDGYTTISVAGELDLASADEFSRAVRSGLAAGDVTIDLRKVSFMDSAGVRALNTALREAAVNDRTLRVFDGMQPSVVQILKLTGMLALLPIDGQDERAGAQ